MIPPSFVEKYDLGAIHYTIQYKTTNNKFIITIDYHTSNKVVDIENPVRHAIPFAAWWPLKRPEGVYICTYKEKIERDI